MQFSIELEQQQFQGLLNGLTAENDRFQSLNVILFEQKFK